MAAVPAQDLRHDRKVALTVLKPPADMSILSSGERLERAAALRSTYGGRWTTTLRAPAPGRGGPMSPDGRL